MTKQKAGAWQSAQMIPVGAIDPGDNDRKDFDQAALEELARSIAALAEKTGGSGLLQPITVVPAGDRFRLVAGERRWRAHILLGRDAIEAIVRDDLGAEAESAAMLVENVVRRDLDPIAEARAYQTRMQQFGQTADDLQAATGKPAAHIRRRLRLLDLCADVQGMVSRGHVPIAMAELMSPLDSNRQRAALRVLAGTQDGRMLTLDGFRTVVARLQEEQDQESMFDLADFFVAQTVAMAPDGERSEWWRDVIPTAADLPAPKVARSMTFGDMIEGWVADLQAAGEGRGAECVGALLAAMIERKVAVIAPGGRLAAAREGE